jgi:GNAT superfamily N-acetyltransferase
MSATGDPADSDWTIRSYERDWLLVMSELAPLLATNYPQGDLWLSRRLDDVQDGRAAAHLALAGRQLAGIAIETPKRAGQLKLSTLWVAPGRRGHGLGGQLVDRCVDRWLSGGVPRAWVTVGAGARESVGALLTGHGFRETAMEPDRYGPGRHEWVLHWTPEQHMLPVSGRGQRGSDRNGVGIELVL